MKGNGIFFCCGSATTLDEDKMKIVVKTRLWQIIRSVVWFDITTILSSELLPITLALFSKDTFTLFINDLTRFDARGTLS